MVVKNWVIYHDRIRLNKKRKHQLNKPKIWGNHQSQQKIAEIRQISSY